MSIIDDILDLVLLIVVAAALAGNMSLTYQSYKTINNAGYTVQDKTALGTVSNSQASQEKYDMSAAEVLVMFEHLGDMHISCSNIILPNSVTIRITPEYNNTLPRTLATVKASLAAGKYYRFEYVNATAMRIVPSA